MVHTALTFATVAWESPLWRAATVVVGLGLLWAAIMAAVGVMLVPRPTSQKLALWVSRACHFIFRVIARRARNYTQLDRYLAVQGPTTVLLYLAAFLAIFVAAFSFLFYGVTGCSPPEAFYRAGSSMSTLGVMSASNFDVLAVMFVAAFTGTTVISVFIGFLLTLYSAYTERESYMSKVALVCGEPAWGPEMVVRLHKLQAPPHSGEWGDCIDWICALRVSHYIYPLLNHFRSPVRDRHWVVTLLAVLDAAAIRVAALEGKIDPESARILAQGAATFHALKSSEASQTEDIEPETAIVAWLIEQDIKAPVPGETPPECGVTRAEWDQAMNFMVSAGITLLPDRDASWRAFCQIRSHYFETAYALACHLSAVNAPWSGSRHPAFDFPQAWPARAQQQFGSGA